MNNLDSFRPTGHGEPVTFLFPWLLLPFCVAATATLPIWFEGAVAKPVGRSAMSDLLTQLGC